jgi:hypothetical protein
LKKERCTGICVLIVIIAVSIFTNSCKKDDNKPTAPVLTTSPISNITSTKANCGGNVSSEGGAAVTARGVCWNTGQTPTLSDNKTTDGTGLGDFSSTITGLTLGVTYYVRAYATNSAGTTYGDQTSFTAAYGVSDSYQGGIIAYILQSGDPGYVSGQLHGLIAAPSDQSSGIQWYNGSYIATGATGASTGNTNTNTIVSHQGSGNYAAKLCYDLALGGYSDWYLPSKAELSKLYLNRAAIGGFTSNYYWSSTEYAPSGAGNAWFYSFTGGYQGYGNKMNTYAVRAVRAF